MARARRNFQLRRVAPTRAQVQRIGTFAAGALGTVDWAAWYATEDYRVYTNLQVFAGGMAIYAGKPPTIQALIAGMQAVYDFARINAPWPPPAGFAEPDKPDMAADAAIETARVVYEENAVNTALAALVPRWTALSGTFQSAVMQGGE